VVWKQMLGKLNNCIVVTKKEAINIGEKGLLDKNANGVKRNTASIKNTLRACLASQWRCRNHGEPP
jgi:hypothetical protein